MVNTRSQNVDSYAACSSGMEQNSNNESEYSFPNTLSRNQINEFETGDLINVRHNASLNSVDQRFMEMNKQISDLTNIVLALTEKISSSTTECSGLNTVINTNMTRSDMVTGVSTNSSPTPNIQQPRRTLPTPATHQNRDRAPPTNEPQMDDVLTEIHNLRTTMTDGVIQPKILQTQVPLFRGNREKYNEFEHLLKNHLRPHMNKLTEEQKLNYFQSLLRDEAIEFWQTLKITTETTLQDVLQAFTKEYAKEDLKEVSKNKFDQMRYDPTKESFADFLTRYKKLAKQAYGDKANDIAETFLFAKLPIQIQNELAMAGKHDAKVEEIKTFVQRRCQYAQLLPGTSDMQPLNQIYNYQPKQQSAQPAPNNNTTEKTAKREVKRRFEGNCRYCNILGHKWIECRKRLRDEANGITKKSQQRPQPGNNNAQQQETEKPRYNSKLVCQICGKVGHSARDCRDRVPGASAYRNVPYDKQSTNENREFRREFKQSQNNYQPTYQVTQATNQTTQPEETNDCYDMDYNDEFDTNSKNL